MSLQITSLNSGSNGNCYYVGNSTEAILIDIGITCKEVEKRMIHLRLDINILKAVFVSHEHTDHIKGVAGFANKYNLPVFMTSATWKNSGILVKPELVKLLQSEQPTNIGNLSITGFPKFHDAVDPHSFIISQNKTTIGVFTDIGRCCDRVKKYFKLCNAAFLESNYDEELLENGRYPYFLKNRIRGGKGHLSNDEAYEIFHNYRSSKLSHLLLSHLSKENNCPVKARKTFLHSDHDVHIIIASRFEATEVYSIPFEYTAFSSTVFCSRKPSQPKLVQLSIF